MNTTTGIADQAFRRGIIVFRWIIIVAYVVLVRTGALDVENVPFVLSASWLCAITLFISWYDLTRQPSQRVDTAIGYLDIVNTSMVMVALRDPRNPVWDVYLITLIGAAHIATRTEMARRVLWTMANYGAVAMIASGQGHEVSWGYVFVVLGVILATGTNFTFLAAGQERIRGLIATVADTDSLTGIANRRHFHHAYPVSLERAIADNTPLALMLIDFDYFKRVNDEQGHPAGDDKLREVAHSLESVLRRGDLVARYGGDEFIVVAPHAGRADALMLAERLREAALICDASVSIGVAIFPEDGRDEDGLVAAADAALYQAKEAGRNCVREAVAAA